MSRRPQLVLPVLGFVSGFFLGDTYAFLRQKSATEKDLAGKYHPQESLPPPPSPPPPSRHPLSRFELEEILEVGSSSTSGKTKAVVKGKMVNDDSSALVILEKEPFTADEIHSFFSEYNYSAMQVEPLLSNDIYQYFQVRDFDSSQSPIKVSLIAPASEKQIEGVRKKARESREVFLLSETKEMYEKERAPWIESLGKNRIQWIYNVLDVEKRKEKCEEKIVYDSPQEFVMIVDPKSKEGATQFHYLGLPYREDLKSVRDLRGDQHLSLLRGFLKKGKEAAAKEAGCSEKEIVAYIHYPPSYYHFHVHFVHILRGTDLTHAHLLENVVDQLEKDPLHFQNSTLHCKNKSFV